MWPGARGGSLPPCSIGPIERASGANAGGREHVELELPVAVDELGVREEVDPVVHVHVEGAEQPVVLPGAALEELARLDLPGLAEVVDEQVAHLPAVAHLLDHDPADAVGVVVGGRGLEEVALLLDRGELRVALVDDEVQERVADRLVGDLRDPLPLVPAPGSRRTRSRRSSGRRTWRRTGSRRTSGSCRPMSFCQARKASIQSSNVAIFFMISSNPYHSGLCRLLAFRSTGKASIVGVREPLAADHALLRPRDRRRRPGPRARRASVTPRCAADPRYVALPRDRASGRGRPRGLRWRSARTRRAAAISRRRSPGSGSVGLPRGAAAPPEGGGALLPVQGAPGVEEGAGLAGGDRDPVSQVGAGTVGRIE